MVQTIALGAFGFELLQKAASKCENPAKHLIFLQRCNYPKFNGVILSAAKDP
jgi:hypothetical protein